MYLWSLVNTMQQWVTQDFGFCFFYTAANELFVNGLLHKNSWSSQTTLALVEEQAAVGLLHSMLYCKVGGNKRTSSLDESDDSNW